MRLKTFESYHKRINEEGKFVLVCQTERKIAHMADDFEFLFSFNEESSVKFLANYMYVSKKIFTNIITARIQAKTFLRKYGVDNDLFIYIDVFDVLKKTLVINPDKQDRKYDMYDVIAKAFREKIRNILDGNDFDCNLAAITLLFPEEAHRFRGRMQGKKFNF